MRVNLKNGTNRIRKKNTRLIHCCRSFVLVFLLAVCLLGCDGTKEKECSITLLTPTENETVDICHEKLRKYLDEEDYDTQCNLLKLYKGRIDDFSVVNFTWESDESESYTLYLSETEDFQDARIYKGLTETECARRQLMPGTTYYWKVEGDKEGSASPVQSFTTVDKPVRWIYVDENVPNVRDIGGWKTENGKQIAYGKIYRGSCLEEITPEGLSVLRDELGIRTDLDFRTMGQDEGMKEGTPLADCNYVNAPFQFYTYIFPQFHQTEPTIRKYDDRTPEAMREIFEVLSNEENYPIYLHCKVGADRTGTAMFLINGLCGVSYEDLTRDYELTSFSRIGQRWRGSVDNFRNGVMHDSEKGGYVAWGTIYEYMMKYYATDDGKLSSAIENYLCNFCKVPQEQLDSVKQILKQ